MSAPPPPYASYNPSTPAAGAMPTTPPGPPPYPGANPTPAVPAYSPSPYSPSAYSDGVLPQMAPPQMAPPTTDNRLFIGVRNVVVCRDTAKECTGTEQWRFEMGSTSGMHENNTLVVHSAGVVVAAFLTRLVGLDAATGALRWDYPLGMYGYTDLVTLTPAGRTVYVGVQNRLLAVSVHDGRLQWQRDVGAKTSLEPYLLTVAVCGPALFVVAKQEFVCLGAADGVERWRFKPAKKSAMMVTATAAWDGADRVLVGTAGYIHPVDLSTGRQYDRINLKGTGYNPVCLVYDAARRQFYAATNGVVYGLSAGDSGANRVLWQCSVAAKPHTNLQLDAARGRLYCATNGRVACVDTQGHTVFETKYVEKTAAGDTQFPLLDLAGPGRLYVGSGGRFTVLDREGNTLGADELPGMRHGPVSLCTTTTSPDINATADVYYINAKIRSDTTIVAAM